MAKRKKATKPLDVFNLPELPVHIYRAGDVVRILGIERWRLEKFITGTQYRLSPYGHLGKGKGSWRLYSLEDLYRLGIATRMAEDGFTAKFISAVLQEIEDRDLLEIDQSGIAVPPNVGLFRTEKGPVARFLYAHERDTPYYVLKLGKLIEEIDSRRYNETERR
jgi:hypothetical protein